MAQEEKDAAAVQSVAEFVTEEQRKPRSNVYTLMLILTFLIFGVSIYMMGKELAEIYDVQFWGMVESPNSTPPQPESKQPNPSNP